MACSRKDNCELFPLISINGALKIWQSFYCDGNYHTCVRYQLGLEGKPIPISLLPNGKNLELNTPKASNVSSVQTQQHNVSKQTDVPTKSISEPLLVAKSEAEINTTEINDEAVVCNHYLRMKTNGSADLHAKIVAILGQFEIDVEMMIEKKLTKNDSQKSAIFLTAFVSEKNMNDALLRISELDGVSSKPICIELEKSTTL